MCWMGGVAVLCSLRLEFLLPGAIFLGIYPPLCCFQLIMVAWLLFCDLVDRELKVT